MSRSIPSRLGLSALLCLAFLVIAPSLAAQAPSGTASLRKALLAARDSTRVRLTAPGLWVDDGLFLGLEGDSLRVAEADAAFLVGLHEVESLSLRRSRWLGVGAQAGAVGLVVGAAAGFFLGYFNCGDLVQDCGGHARDVALRWSGVFATAGAVTGGLLGSRMKRWGEVYP